jgi:hypothetical protein
MSPDPRTPTRELQADESGEQIEILVPEEERQSDRFSQVAQKLRTSSGWKNFVPPTYEVDGQGRRTTAPHGLSGPEVERISGAVHFMHSWCQTRHIKLWWLSSEKGSSRELLAKIWKRITRLQRDQKLPAYSTEVLESRGGLHCHIIFVGSVAIAHCLRRSAFGASVEVAVIGDPNRLARGYLCKERTSQAGYRKSAVLGGRLKGSHRLDGGGDRVRLSRDLERDAIEARYVEPWQHTNAKRCAERKPYSLRRLSSRKAPRPAGQLSLLPEIDRPVSRLHDFGGGFVPPAVAVEIEFLRRQHGWSQRQLGAKIGRSQGHMANALRGHDPISSLVVNRLREILPLRAVDDVR